MSYSRPPRLAYVAPDPVDGDAQCVYLMPLPDGPPVLLEGSAAVIWLVAVRGVEDVCGAVAARMGAAPGEIADDVGAYLQVLVGRGLLGEGPVAAGAKGGGVPSLR